MDIPKSLQKLKRILVGADTATLAGRGNVQTDTNRVIACKPCCPRRAIAVGLAVCISGGPIRVLIGTGGGVHRVPINRLTIGTVTEAPSGDYIAVRGAAAPYLSDYLSSNQQAALKPIAWLKQERQRKR
jgi:hypothetical protein